MSLIRCDRVDVLGKVPWRNEYVRPAAATAALTSFDSWMAESVDAATRGPSGWGPGYANGAMHAFVYRPSGAAGAEGMQLLAGAVTPSQDGAGRQYPVALAGTLVVPSRLGGALGLTRRPEAEGGGAPSGMAAAGPAMMATTGPQLAAAQQQTSKSEVSVNFSKVPEGTRIRETRSTGPTATRSSTIRWCRSAGQIASICRPFARISLSRATTSLRCRRKEKAWMAGTSPAMTGHHRA